MIKILRKNIRMIIILLFLFLFLMFNFIVSGYQYRKCVSTNKEELKKCENEELGNYDCSVFENAEELCRHVIYK